MARTYAENLGTRNSELMKKDPAAFSQLVTESIVPGSTSTTGFCVCVCVCVGGGGCS